MTDLYHFQGESSERSPTKLTIASGPVIIEDGKVLLDKHGDDDFWKFPGGRMPDGVSIKENCILKAKEELGVDIELLSNPFLITLEKEQDGVKEYVLLVHYAAKRKNEEISPREDIKEWAWHDLENLPEDCAPNIESAVKHFS